MAQPEPGRAVQIAPLMAEVQGATESAKVRMAIASCRCSILMFACLSALLWLNDTLTRARSAA